MVINLTLLGSLEKAGTQEGLDDLGLAAPSEPSIKAIINTGGDGVFNLNTSSIAGKSTLSEIKIHIVCDFMK